jgi:hypothetical protein
MVTHLRLTGRYVCNYLSYPLYRHCFKEKKAERGEKIQIYEPCYEVLHT